MYVCIYTCINNAIMVVCISDDVHVCTCVNDHSSCLDMQEGCLLLQVALSSQRYTLSTCTED